MTVYMFPSITPSSSTFELVTNTRTFQSPLTNSVQTASRKGSLWKISMRFNNLSGNDRAIMQGFLAKMNGQQHRMYLHDHSAVKRGIAPDPADTLVVNSAGQTGSTLVASGATGSQTGYLKAGDYISFNNELHMVTDDCNSTGSNTVSIPIAPPIRKPTETTNSQDVIDYLQPIFGVFMLSSATSWDTQPGIVSNFTVEAVEDVLA
tara:strand:- start:635 stop:1252 length:618 start_codon:yes stop_codon:yes gene_type:complete